MRSETKFDPHTTTTYKFDQEMMFSFSGVRPLYTNSQFGFDTVQRTGGEQ